MLPADAVPLPEPPVAPGCPGDHLRGKVDADADPYGHKWEVGYRRRSLADVEAISLHKERMPAKSTYFYPKLLSGLVINPLE